ncbi:MAG: isoprenyl transferase [Candidatus Omnitrophota bacterium]
MVLPKHVAIIMDGNGRWAKQRGLERFKGHTEGLKRVSEIVNESAAMGIEVLTLYTFSKQNWSRPENEITMLMQMICIALEKRMEELISKDIRFNFLGQEDGVPEKVLNSLNRTKKATGRCKGLQVNLAFNYDSRSEIIDGILSIVKDVKEDRLDAGQINEDLFSSRLYTRGLPDPDLLIRTSGEKRLSNFLLWQISYTELYFTNILWPDFTVQEFRKAIDEFEKRERRFGNIVPN